MGIALIPILWLAAAGPAETSAALAGPTGPVLSDDPTLLALVSEAMQRRPELAAVRATIRAERERVPQAQALPDPTLSLGIQNDGFRAIQIGRMETSFLAVTASQTFPWAGKRGLRGEVAELAAAAAEADLRRTQLSIRADVERAYLDLLLVRAELALLTRVEALWSQSEVLARVRYEAGEGAQSDLLRAQLERQRLRQQRWSLEAEERRRVVVMNRLRGHALDEPVATQRRLEDVPDPAVADPGQAIANAEAESPELKQALLAGQQSSRGVALAKRERWPDVTVSAGLMPRWGSFETMWQASVGVNLPVWSARKQTRAVAENQARAEAAAGNADAIRQLLRQRIQERLTSLGALVQANRLYRSDLLVESEATVVSTLAQYQVGRVSFASVLEALAGYLADRNGFLDSVAAAQRIAIAEREVSLEAVVAEAGALAAPSPSPSPATKGSAGATPAMSRM